MNTRGELAGCRPAHPPPEAERQAGDSQSRKGATSAPKTASSTKLRAGSQLLTKCSWDPGRLISTGSQPEISSPEETQGHMWDGAPAALPGNQAAGTGEVIRCTAHLGRVHSPSTWSPELGRAQNAGPTKYVLLWSTREPEPEQLRPGTCTQPRARFR